MSVTSSAASSPANSRPSSPVYSSSSSSAASSRAGSPVRRPLSTPAGGGGADFNLNAVRNALPPIRTNRNQTQNNNGGGYTPQFEAARQGGPVPRFNPNPQDPSPNTVLSPPGSETSEASSPERLISPVSSSSAESSPAGSPPAGSPPAGSDAGSPPAGSPRWSPPPSAR